MQQRTTECLLGCDASPDPHVHIHYIAGSDHEAFGLPPEIIQFKQPTLKERFRMGKNKDKKKSSFEKMDESARQMGYIRMEDVKRELPSLINAVLDEREETQRREAEEKEAFELWQKQQEFISNVFGEGEPYIGAMITIEDYYPVWWDSMDRPMQYVMRTPVEGQVTGTFAWLPDNRYKQCAWVRLSEEL